MQDNQDAETSTDEVQRENKKIKKIPLGARFSASVQTGLGAHPAFYTMKPGYFAGVSAAGAWR